MKIIKTAEPIEINGGSGKIGTRTLVVHLINSQPAFNSTGPGIRMAARIEAALTGVTEEAGKRIALAPSDWAALRDAAENPAAGYGITPARAMLAHVDAIVSASDGET